MSVHVVGPLLLISAVSLLVILKQVMVPAHKQLPNLDLPPPMPMRCSCMWGYTGCPNECLAGLDRLVAMKAQRGLETSIFVNVLDHLPDASTDAYVSRHIGVHGWTPTIDQRDRLLAQLGSRIQRHAF